MDGAYGGARAGTIFDPVTFVQKPQVIVRGVCWLFAVIVFWSISSKGYLKDKDTDREQCLYNNSGACGFGVMVGIIAFLASIAFIAGEYLFEQMSSAKSRKHYVLADIGFSCFWAFVYFICFCYLSSQWSKAKTPPDGYGVTSLQAAIAFSFFSIFSWAGCAYFAYQRFLIGPGDSFVTNYDIEGNVPGGAPYSNYAAERQDNPFEEPSFDGGYNQIS